MALQAGAPVIGGRRGGGSSVATSGSSSGGGGGGGGGKAVPSNMSRLVLLVAFAAAVFLFGAVAGAHIFDARGTATESAKPWQVLTKQHLRIPSALPPGVKAHTEHADGAAAAAVPPASVAGGQGKPPVAPPLPPPPAPPAAPAEPLTLAAVAAAGPALWSDFGGRKSVEFAGALDSPQISFGAWVYLDGRDRSAVIKMIASNRHGGCVRDDAHRGWSFYVNNWQTEDRALVLEWRNARDAADGCARLSSDGATIPYDTWVHVGFALAAADGDGQQALLFLNGELLRAASVSRSVDDVQGDGVHLVIGGSPDRQYSFDGRIAHVFIAKTVVTPAQLLAAGRITTEEGFRRLAEKGKAKLSTLLLLSGDDAVGGSAGEEGGEAAGAPAAAAAAGSWRQVAAELYAADLIGDTALVVPKVAASGATTGSGAKLPPLVLPASVGKPPLAVGVNAPFLDAGNVDKTPAVLRRGRIPGTLPAGAVADFTTGGNQWVPSTIRLPAAVASDPVTSKEALAAGTFTDDVTLAQLVDSDTLGRSRASAVVDTMRHAWSNYKDKAWGFDELKPRSGTGQDNWSGVGMTLVDSLDTLWLMGMEKEFAEAKAWVSSRLNFDKYAAISVFEITIRELGGLLSAFDLSGDRVFVDKARDLADRLLPAFNTPTGIPRSTITLASGQSSTAGWTGGAAILSELGTLQVEFRRLSRATGAPVYGRKAEAVIEKLEPLRPAFGLYPIYISPDSGTATSTQVTFGALGDSFYEYLLKVWLQGGRKEAMYRRMYDAAMQGLTDKLLKRTRQSKLLYVADWDGANTQDKMDHLVCFVPGMLALGAYTAAGTAGEAHAVRDLQNAKALMYTCWQFYERTAVGISPEFVEFPGGGDPVVPDRAPFYILRPEAAESLFILHQLTGNPIYREWGWKMYQAIERYCRVEFGYGAHPDVRDPGRVPDDRMESFFLAETLKYLYLLQSPDHPISLDRYVFNTEAHPTRIFSEMP